MNYYKTENIWFDAANAQINKDGLVVSKNWFGSAENKKRGYQVTITGQGNWGGEDNIFANYSYSDGCMQTTYKWRVWRVTDNGTTLIDPANLEGAEYGAVFSENVESDGQGSGFTFTDVYVDDAIEGNDTKTVKYIVRYYTERLSTGATLPSSGGPPSNCKR